MRRMGECALATAIVILCVLCASQLIACGGNTRQKTLHASFVGVTAACDGLLAWDTTKQEQIVAAATSKEEGRAKIDEHRTSMNKLYDGCNASYRAIAAASLNKDELTMKTATEVAKNLLDAITKLRGDL